MSPRLTLSDLSPKHQAEVARQLAGGKVLGQSLLSGPQEKFGVQKVTIDMSSPRSVSFTIPGEPMGKPRMTQRDKWAKRDCVVRYHDWADSARACIPQGMSQKPSAVRVVAYFTMPASWSKIKKEDLCGGIHQQKPDVDNIAKSVMDALWKDDSCIADLRIRKFWTNSGRARVELEVLP